jgi:uncharacterized membrane protein
MADGQKHDYSFYKTWSWAFVSFWVISGIDVIAHLAMHGTESFQLVFSTIVVGTAVSCVGKSPVYLLHEKAWAKYAARQHRGPSAPARPALDGVCLFCAIPGCDCQPV